MAPDEQIGVAKSAEFTTPALQFTDVWDMEFDPDTGDTQKQYGPSRYPRITVGNDNMSFTFKTRNAKAHTDLIKNMQVEVITFTWQAPFTTPTPGSGAVGLQHAKLLTAVLSCGCIAESIKLSTGEDKKPAEYQVKIIPAIKESDGAEPTITWGLAAAAP